ncbi:hypothetical protein FRB94_010310 [Tulasnella sp. JGI-2019a]|nr:hypothetical protein FRB94_010310 [Tulasnella sp. JGI-2019a]
MANIVPVLAIDALIQSYLDKPANELAGLVIMAVDKKGKFIYRNALGKRSVNPGKNEAMTMDTVHWIASQTKLMTAVAVMQCVERGQIGLDDPVGEVCPELAGRMIIEGFEDDGTPKMRNTKTKITLRYKPSVSSSILNCPSICMSRLSSFSNHTSGFAYAALHPSLTPTAIKKWIKATGFKPKLTTGHIDTCDFPLIFEPESRWMYGVGVDWAGQVVERLNNCTLEEYMAKHIFQPLDMTDTTFHPEYRPDFDSRMVDTCVRRPDGSLEPGKQLYARPAAQGLGGAGCYSTCPDYIKFLTAILQDGGAILKKESVDEIFKPQLTDSAQLSFNFLRKWFSWTPTSVEISFGLTVDINVDPIPGGRAAGSGNWGGLPMLAWWYV